MRTRGANPDTRFQRAALRTMLPTARPSRGSDTRLTETLADNAWTGFDLASSVVHCFHCCQTR
eukprot:8399002-Lingulodinium_polyedra.AAC.1